MTHAGVGGAKVNANDGASVFAFSSGEREKRENHNDLHTWTRLANKSI